MKNPTSGNKTIVITLIVAACLSSMAFAVTSKIDRHTSAEDFLKGTTDNTSVDSDGTIRLSRQTEPIELGKLLDDAWSINSIVAAAKNTVYLGTSPNGRIIKYKNGKATILYEPATDESNEADSVGTPFLNLHVFALAADSKGRVLAAISGAECKLLRFDGKKHDVIFESETEKYIFAIALDRSGNIFLGTGPNGKIYMLDPRGNKSKIVADLADNNVLSLAAGPDRTLYAGTDQRGLVYKIDLSSQKASVLYDTDQLEVTSLIFDDNGYLYAAATSANAARQQDMFTSLLVEPSPGRSDSDDNDDEAKGSTDFGTTLEIPNAKEASPKKTDDSSLLTKRGEFPRSAGHIYKITPDGFVTDIFSEMAVLFSMVMYNDNLLLGTGNNAQLFSVDPETENKTIDYEHSQASQITALAVDNNFVFIGTANPPKLLKLSTAYASSGSFTSDLIDAEQPAKWGKLLIDADMPSGCKIFLSARSSNLGDPNDSAFSEWTKPVKITNATQLDCPNARFCQYKLIIENKGTKKTPVIRQVAVAHMVPNLAPKVLSVNTKLSSEEKENMIITFKAKDDNKDKLLYDIDFRKLGRKKWIELEDDTKETRFEWNTNTVEDGKYEIMVTADDKLSNTQTTKLSAFRISDPVVVDNTPPVIEKEKLDIAGQNVTLSLKIKDSLTIIGNLSYTIDSNDDWISTLPDDLVYDTTHESFVVVLNDLDAGEHVIAVKISDDLGNTVYKTYDVDIKGKK